MVDCFTKIVKNEGFSRLYRGITAPILMEAPKRWVPAGRSMTVGNDLQSMQSYQIRSQ